MFRTLDVDKYSEDIYKEDQEVSETTASAADDDKEVKDAHESLIESLLAAGKVSEALSRVLTSTSLGLKDPAAREANLNAVMKVMMSYTAVMAMIPYLVV